MAVSIDSSLLLSYYTSRSGSGAAAGTGATSTASKKVAPTAPWTSSPTPAAASAAVKGAMNGTKLINESAAQLDLPGASSDYRKLFALYQGLTTLSGVAEQMQGKGLTSLDKTRIQSTFAKGMAEVTSYIANTKLDQLRLKQGDVAGLAKTTVGVAKTKTEYVTDPVTTSTTDSVAAYEGDVQFNISVKRVGVTHDVAIDLADMDPQTRSITNVIAFINGKLADAGVETRLGTQRLPGAERSITVGGKAVKLAPGPDQWALKVKIGTSETVNFSAPDTAPALYVAQTVGNPDPDGKASTADAALRQQLLKFQTEPGAPPPLQEDNAAYWVDGRAFAETLGPEVKTVHDTKVGPDGSVYMLADVTAKTAGQEIKGDQDVALLKYDPAGKLVYSRTLGAAETATGLALAVSADGKIAIAGSVTGVLGGATEGPLNSGPTGAFADMTDSFVTLMDADGQELWTQRRGARQNDEASEITFGSDGTVYVAGRSQSGMPGTTGVGGWDSYIQGFKADVDSKGKVQTLFTQSFGTTESDRPAGMVVDGTNLTTASVENGRAVLRRFDISSGTPVQTAMRDLGDLQGGEITGLALDNGKLIVAGSTSNGALNAGTVTNALAGGVDAFAASLSDDLSVQGTDAIAYYGGTGDDRAASLAVANGKVYIGGSAGADLPGEDPVGKKDGFLAELDIAGGEVTWSRRFSGQDGYAVPAAIAVDTTGSSVLDRLGLPKGTLDLTDSAQITAVSSIRAGDTFTVKVGDGRAQTVTIEAKDTLDTLAQKIRRATGFQSKVTISTTDGVRRIQIAPLNDRSIIEFGPGKTDKDALSALGIPEGVVRASKVVGAKTVPADGKGGLYGLSLDSALNLDDTNGLNHALADLAQAMGVIRSAYKDLVAAASPQTAATAAAKAAASGKVPTYLTNQIANYQAALTRLGG